MKIKIFLSTFFFQKFFSNFFLKKIFQKNIFQKNYFFKKFFFKNWTLSLLYPYGALTSCKKLEKSLERSLKYLKTDGRTTDGRTDYGRTDMGDYIGPSRVNPGSKKGFGGLEDNVWRILDI